ncbi:hypothetical protein [Fodinibius sediminis]|uniref:Uncharacterized protein n=1 Tax=Fodinibius sediminis TaxID=1214077 RepID=A0A521BDK1_9BACT|nr:hypothetical protein [Fodinibius sediminis]SMO45188.1 hypothetical protein SAMN06265218_10319 [Fodinibius sediminis]
MGTSEPREVLVKKIKAKRKNIQAFVHKLEPKGTRLTTLNIWCSGLATVFTASPAIGGPSFLEVFGGSGPDSVTWRILFALAALFSVSSVIFAGLYKARDIATKLSEARACDAKLEGLETLLELEKISSDDAVIQYNKLVEESAFIPKAGWRGDILSLDWATGEIAEPHPNQVTKSSIACSGWVEGLGADLHLWLAVEIDNSIWPKEGEIFVDDDGSWYKSIHDVGSEGPFSLSLFVADKKANKRIRAWLDERDQAGDYPELHRFPGLRRIDRVDGLRHEETS